MNEGGNVVPRITKAEHIGPFDTGDNIEAKRAANYIWDTNSSSWIRQTASAAGGGVVSNDGTFAKETGGNLDTITANIGNHTKTGGVSVTAASALADTEANPTVERTGSMLMAYNGTTWDRLHGFFLTADGSSVQTGLYTLPQNLVYNGSTWDRMRGDVANGVDVDVTRSVLPTGAATSANQLPNNHNVVVTSAPTTAVTGTVTATKAKGASTTSTNVSTSTSVVALVASNSARIKATIYNDSTTGVLYVKEGSAASTTSFNYALSAATATTPGGLLICDDYTGVLTGILSAGTGTARVGET